jgi:hypothetical protein
VAQVHAVLRPAASRPALSVDTRAPRAVASSRGSVRRHQRTGSRLASDESRPATRTYRNRRHSTACGHGPRLAALYRWPAPPAEPIVWH